MIQTIKPDERGRVSILPYLQLLNWKYGEAVEVDFIKIVKISTNKEVKQKLTNEEDVPKSHDTPDYKSEA